MTRFGQEWFDGAAGPLVRPYAVTRGRTMGAGHDLDMLTLVITVRSAPTVRRVEPEYAVIIGMCRIPQSVAEVAAAIRLPLAVTKILVGDLIADGQLNFRSPAIPDGPGDLNLLRAVLHGIRRL